MLDYYRGAPDLNESGKGEAGKGDFERFVTGDRLFINLGKMDGLDKGRLLSLVCDRTGIKGQDIGKIELKGAYSFFEVEKAKTQTVREHLHGFDYKGRIVRIEVTDAAPQSERSGRSGRSGGRGDRHEGPGKKFGPKKSFQKSSPAPGRKKESNWFDSKMKGW
jgi:ATP-dependent RNA helicase DeaD